MKDPTLNLFKAIDARREAAAPGPCVHFNGHIDVVRSGGGWTVDPFGAEVKDGRVYEDMVNSAKVMALAARSLLCGSA